MAWRYGFSAMMVAVAMIAAPVRATAAAAARTDPWVAAADLFFKIAARDDAIPDAGVPRAVAQDGEGFIWLATDGGLARWDGTGFKSYVTDPTDGSGALPELMVNMVYADRAGLLWLGMSADGLWWRDPQSDRFRRPLNRTALDQAHITLIVDDGGDGLWVGSDVGLGRVRGPDHRATMIRDLPAGAITALHRSRSGALWVAVGARLFRQAGARFVPIALAGVEGEITGLHDDAAGGLWLATHGSGLHRLAAGTVRHWPLRVDGRSPPLGAIIDAGAGQLWVTSRAGIVTIDPLRLQINRLVHDANLAATLPENGINHLFRDRSGLVWVASDAVLSYVDPAPRRVLGLVGALRPTPTEAVDVAWTLGAAPDGAIWYGSPDGPASRLAPTGKGQPGAVRRLSGARRDAQSFAFTPAGDGFVAGGDGLYQVSRDGRRSRMLSPLPWSRLLIRGTQMFVGGGSDNGRARSGGVATVDLRHPGAPMPTPWSGRLTDPRVRSLAMMPGNLLWVGTARGLNRVDLASGAVTRLVRGDAMSGLRGNYVSTLLADRQGRLWAGTVGGGITILARGPAGWRAVAHIGRRDGLPHDTVDKLLADRGGTIWASTDGGIAQIDPASLTVTPLRAADGVPFTAYWTGGGATMGDGRLMFAGFGGLTLVDPAAPARPATTAPLRFTAIRANGQPVIAPAGQPLTVPTGQRSLTAEFARLDYAGARDQIYAYRLLPYETGWTRTDALHRVARYTNIPPGRATLMIATVTPGAHGGWRIAAPPLTLEIDVARRWFETIAFRILATVAAFAIVYMLVHLRLRHARARQKHLERLVERRTAELLASQSELEKLAYTDTLTGLGNRRLYGETLSRHLGAARHAPFALLLIDLDRFKQVNDELGHDVGDALLVEVADRLTAAIRQQDSIFRLGGDEFAIIIASLDSSRAIGDMCRRLYAAFADPVIAGPHRLQVMLSIGAVVARAEGLSTEAVYKLADLALYDAKRSGRGTWRLSPTEPGG